MQTRYQRNRQDDDMNEMPENNYDDSTPAGRKGGMADWSDDDNEDTGYFDTDIETGTDLEYEDDDAGI